MQPQTTSEPDRPPLGDLLSRETYVLSRTQPFKSDPDYLILSDLREVVREFAVEVTGRLFDYGCGGAPYRDFFAKCTEYIGADVTPGPLVDCLLSADGLSDQADQSFDAVFSSQVLEHVSNPEAYLRECFRLLKPGGRLQLSTHGMFHEHGCPDDYYRWTSAGLEAAVKREGFKVIRSVKVTCGARCAVQTGHYLQLLQDWKRMTGLWRWLVRIERGIYKRLAVPFLNLIADQFPADAIRHGNDPSALYTGVAVVAERPRSDS